MNEACVVALAICPVAGQPMKLVQQVKAIAGQGLEGDRYCFGEGSFNKGEQGVRQVTLMNSLFFKDGIWGYEESRRNIFTVGAELMWLIDREFQVGEAIIRGVKYCEPCNRPSKLAGRNGTSSFKDDFLDRGGLIGEIVQTGIITVGSQIILPRKSYE